MILHQQDFSAAQFFKSNEVISADESITVAIIEEKSHKVDMFSWHEFETLGYFGERVEVLNVEELEEVYNSIGTRIEPF
jgi:hypothetical protein